MTDQRLRNMSTATATDHPPQATRADDLVNKDLVPAWLWIVVAALLIWGFYYLVTYWSAPIIPA